MNKDSDFGSRVSSIFSNHLNLLVPSRDTDLFEEGILDSLVFVDLLVHLESEFDVVVAPEELEFDDFRTINRIAAFVGAANQSGSHDGS